MQETQTTINVGPLEQVELQRSWDKQQGAVTIEPTPTQTFVSEAEGIAYDTTLIITLALRALDYEAESCTDERSRKQVANLLDRVEGISRALFDSGV